MVNSFVKTWTIQPALRSTPRSYHGKLHPAPIYYFLSLTNISTAPPRIRPASPMLGHLALERLTLDIRWVVGNQLKTFWHWSRQPADEQITKRLQQPGVSNPVRAKSAPSIDKRALKRFSSIVIFRLIGCYITRRQPTFLKVLGRFKQQLVPRHNCRCLNCCCRRCGCYNCSLVEKTSGLSSVAHWKGYPPQKLTAFQVLWLITCGCYGNRHSQRPTKPSYQSLQRVNLRNINPWHSVQPPPPPPPPPPNNFTFNINNSNQQLRNGAYQNGPHGPIYY